MTWNWLVNCIVTKVTGNNQNKTGALVTLSLQQKASLHTKAVQPEKGDLHFLMESMCTICWFIPKVSSWWDLPHGQFHWLEPHVFTRGCCMFSSHELRKMLVGFLTSFWMGQGNVYQRSSTQAAWFTKHKRACLYLDLRSGLTWTGSPLQLELRCCQNIFAMPTPDTHK